MTIGKSGSTYTIGVDLGGTKIMAGAVDAQGQVLAQEKQPTKSEEGPQAVVRRLADCIETVKAATPGRLQAIGVGCPGTLDLANGTVLFCPNLPGMENFPLARHLGGQFGVPVALGNDVSVAALGESGFGAGRQLGPDSLLVCMFIGTGIGGGLVLNGHIWQGLRGIAGEIGHMVIDRHSNAVCGCGNKGCLESLASRTAIERRIRARLKQGERSEIKDHLKKSKPLKSKVLAEAFKNKDNLVRDEILEACRAVGIGIANLINILDPHLLVLGGGLMESLGEELLPVIRKAADEHVLPHSRTHAPLVVSELLELAGVIGAASLARNYLSQVATAAKR